MTKEEMAKAYSDGFDDKDYREIAYNAFLCGYGAKCEPPLPSDLDEAANNYGVDIRLGYPRVMDETDKYIYNAFKAGAEWMAVQGETHDSEIVSRVTGNGLLPAITCLVDPSYKEGDKVIIQVRKK